jgi:hypothetical protein
MAGSSRVDNAPNQIARDAKHQWDRLCRRYLPVSHRSSIWRFSRRHKRGDPTQGWKLHVSATILSACDICRSIAPYLKTQRVLFKAPRSLRELEKLNTGVDYGFSQVGKFVTVFPPSTEAALKIARDLHRLTTKYRGPVIPYDKPFRNSSCVYYRYGSFAKSSVVVRGEKLAAIVGPHGRRIPDRRGPGSAVPPWLTDPFGAPRPRKRSITSLERDYRDFEALSQRGRGGVYRAVRISTRPKKSCIIKEGRRHGETDLLGRDGFNKIEREARFLTVNAGKVAGLPRVIARLRADNCFYLVVEDVTGRSLQSILASRKKISRRMLLIYCANMAQIVAEIHAAGWAWHDCKPEHFLCQAGGKLRPLDFEAACFIRKPDLCPSGTPGYFVPESKKRRPDPERADLYALGISLAQLLTRTPSPVRTAARFGGRTKIRGMPQHLIETIRSLLSAQPDRRPSARTVYQILQKLLRPDLTKSVKQV